ncbi:11876_t:CDS:2, partial [Gigaspora margarita]
KKEQLSLAINSSLVALVLKPTVDVNWVQAMLAQLLNNNVFKLKNVPHKGKSTCKSKILLPDPLLKVFALKKRKKNDGETKEVETLKENKEEKKDYMHKEKNIIVKKGKPNL